MTPEGEAFANRVDAVTILLKHRLGFFPAMAAGLDTEDWILVYAAARRMADDIRADHDNEAKNLGEEGKLRALRSSTHSSRDQLPEENETTNDYVKDNGQFGAGA